MDINIDRITGKVVNCSSILTYQVEVKDDFDLSKVIKMKTGEKENKETKELEPVYITKIVTFKKNKEEFTGKEILQEKYKKMLEASQCDNIIADAFLSEDDLDLKHEKHSANTGLGFVELLANGQCITKEIELEEETKGFALLEFNSDDEIDIYINDIKFINNKAALSTPANKCVIKFINTASVPKLIKSYAIGY